MAISEIAGGIVDFPQEKLLEIGATGNCTGVSE
jgi:hypothetical protein